MPSIKILAIPGSLREKSSSYKILQVLAANTQTDIEFSIYKGVGTLPHFDDPENTPASVMDFRKQLSEADGILICTPEYAFGVPGSLKNALDWTVSSGEFVNKPTALITASSSGQHGHAALLLILQAISAVIPGGGALLISSIRSKFDRSGELTDEATLRDIENVLDALRAAC
jgi:chromate reductase, NAD(P)H dehydrogenase (quinone)